MNSSCFSQTNTNNQLQKQVNDTTKVKLKPSTARLVIKDIIKGEGCEEELRLTQEKFFKLEEREIQKDTIIKLLTNKDKNNQFMMSQKDIQIGEYKNMTESLQKEIRQNRTKNFFYKISILAGVITTTYFIIIK